MKEGELLEVVKEFRNNVSVVILGAKKEGQSVSGEIELDVDNNYQLTEAVEGELAAGHLKILLNIKLVSYVDSSGLGAIFDSYKQTVEKGGQFKLVSTNIEVRRILDITKISKKIEIFGSEDEALRTFG
ncbi:MAG: STAS domain-containing protein [Candidatus Margulisiibacteriota bacterium]